MEVGVSVLKGDGTIAVDSAVRNSDRPDFVLKASSGRKLTKVWCEVNSAPSQELTLSAAGAPSQSTPLAAMSTGKGGGQTIFYFCYLSSYVLYFARNKTQERCGAGTSGVQKTREIEYCDIFKSTCTEYCGPTQVATDTTFKTAKKQEQGKTPRAENRYRPFGYMLWEWRRLNVRRAVGG